MSERYQIICPECRTELNTHDSTSPAKICPTCKRDITDSFEILFRPSAQSTVPKWIALAILVGLGLIIVAAAVSAYM